MFGSRQWQIQHLVLLLKMPRWRGFDGNGLEVSYARGSGRMRAGRMRAGRMKTRVWLALTLGAWGGHAHAAGRSPTYAGLGAHEISGSGVDGSSSCQNNHAGIASRGGDTDLYLDAALIYVDSLSGRVLNLGDVGPSSRATGSERTRILGLRRLTIGLDEKFARTSGLMLELRPDAVTRQAELTAPSNSSVSLGVREYDDRSGDPGMTPMPGLRLLDAYQLRWLPSNELEISAGVFKNLAGQMPPLPRVLGFGLEVQMPAKFAAARLSWMQSQPTQDGPRASKVGGGSDVRGSRQLALYLMQCGDDRGESLGRKAASSDAGPVAKSPYHGGAIEGSFGGGSPARQFSWRGSGTAGFVEGAASGGSGEQKGKVALAFAGLGGWMDAKLLSRDVGLGIDARGAREGLSGSGGADGSLASISIETSMYWLFLPDLRGNLGLGYGREERRHALLGQLRPIILEGTAVTIGLERRLDAALSADFLLLLERRSAQVPGVGRRGAFSEGDLADASIPSASMASRAALQINYWFGG